MEGPLTRHCRGGIPEVPLLANQQSPWNREVGFSSDSELAARGGAELGQAFYLGL